MKLLEHTNHLEFPVVKISETRSTLSRKNESFASDFQIEFPDGLIIIGYENTGYPLSIFKKESHFAALLEITQAGIFYDIDHAPPKAIPATYLWSEMVYIFFPELVKIQEEMDEAYGTREERLEAQFDAEATRIFTEWGLKGLHLDIYQATHTLHGIRHPPHQ